MKPRRPSDRKPFDPKKVKPDPDEGLLFAGGLPAASSSQGAQEAGPTLLTVSALTTMVRDAIRGAIPRQVRVVGQLSNVSQPAGGHLYYTLKDEQSEIRCVMWRSAAASLKFKLTDGLEVIASGEVDVYEPRGQYQFYVKRMEPRGIGALELAFRQLKDRLQKEGLFDAARKRKIPLMPRRIAVVTSTTGAAISDILQTIQRRFPCVSVFVFPVKVQGQGAAEEIADAIRGINQASDRLGGIDVMIVGRGGGSLEDLWAFNEEGLARAIFGSAIPVVSAVGHETDFTIADFVADLRAATPTAAAELVVPQLADVLAALDSEAHRLSRAVRVALDAARSRLRVAERCEWLRDPAGQIGRRQQQVDEVMGRLRLAAARMLSVRRRRLHDLELRLTHVGPEVQLAKRREKLALAADMLRAAQGRFALRAERRLARMELRLEHASPVGRIERQLGGVRHLADRLRLAGGVTLRTGRREIDALEARLASCGHQQVLSRGFSITRVSDTRRIVTDPSHVHPGLRLATETAGGKINSQVVESERQVPTA